MDDTGGVGIQWELPIFWNTVHGSFPELNRIVLLPLGRALLTWVIIMVDLVILVIIMIILVIIMIIL